VDIRTGIAGCFLLSVLCAPAAHAQSLCTSGMGWRPDPGYHPQATEPTYPDEPPHVSTPTYPNVLGAVPTPHLFPAPRIAVDATHGNTFTVGPPRCLYYPFAQALRADGAVVADQLVAFDPLHCMDPKDPDTCAYRRALATQVDVLVIANPATAISEAEATAIAGWLGVPGATNQCVACPEDVGARSRGLILLVDRQDGIDYPARIAPLAAKLGLTWSNATEIDHTYQAGSPYLLNAFDPVTRGWKGSHKVESVQTFGGATFSAASGVTLAGRSALTLPSPAGTSQGWSFQAGTGRVYAGADPEMFTAQAFITAAGGISRTRGMQTYPENEKFLRNVVHWLDGLCPTGNPYFVPLVSQPTYSSTSAPRIGVDSTHENYRTIEPLDCTYLPFAQLLRADGAVVEDFHTAFDAARCGDLSDLVGCPYAEALKSVDVLAMTAPQAEISDAEAALLEGWVRGDVACDDAAGCPGRGLLLINDHDPFPQRISSLSARLGLDWPVNMDLDAEEFGPYSPTQMTLLDTEHVTTQGFDSSDRVASVWTFDNSYFDELVPGSLAGESILTYAPGFAKLADAAGKSVGWAFDHGLGRVYASGEQAMFTSVLRYWSLGEAAFETYPDNQKYLVNILHWMDGLLPDADGDGLYDGRDNCAITANPAQADQGGVGTTAADGIGDACQCGDVSGNGVVESEDVDAIQDHGLGVANASFVVGGNCDVTGDGACDDQDANAIAARLAGNTPFGQHCQNADPYASPCPSCAP
jgi:hypothetical protein